MNKMGANSLVKVTRPARRVHRPEAPARGNSRLEALEMRFLLNGASGLSPDQSQLLPDLFRSSGALARIVPFAGPGIDYGALAQTPAAVNLDVSPAPTSTQLSSSADPSYWSQAVTFSASISSSQNGTPTGTVTFMDGATTLGTATVVPNGMNGGHATFTTSALAVGSHTITAVYGGDALFAGSSGSLTQTVQPAPTSTTLSSSVNPSASGQAVTFTVGVTGGQSGAPTGTVTFMDGSTTLGTATLGPPPGGGNGGYATFTTSALAVGNHTITAIYGGDALFAASTSAPLTQTV
jgi:hypothetical protein